MSKHITTCLIIEDEPLAQEILTEHIDSIPFLTLTGIAANTFEAADLIKRNKPDLMFLDINMPFVNGLDWLLSQEPIPQNVIITTAYPDHAVEGFDLNVIDYLLKPIKLSRFIKAVNRFQERSKPNTAFVADGQAKNSTIDSNVNDFFVKNGKELIRVSFDEVSMVEGMDDYIRIHLQNGPPIITSMRLQKIEEILPSGNFYRINRSYIVNQKMVSRINTFKMTLKNGKELTISAKYRNNYHILMEKIRTN